MMASGWRCVLVTGATGFLGRVLTAEMRMRGVQVVGVSRSSGLNICVDELPLENVDHVFHLAALTGVPDAWRDPVAFYEVNACGTLRVLDQCHRANIPVTYVSAYVYGRPKTLPISENFPVQANNPYAFSKFQAEEACRFYARYFDLPVSIIRPFNIYGSGQDERFLIPTLTAQVVSADVECITLQDLTPRRDFVYIDDVVNAIVMVAMAGVSDTFNVGSGQSYSVGEVVSMLQKIAGTNKPVVSAERRRQEEIDDVRADITAIEKAVGWRPRISLEQGLTKVMAGLRA